MWTRKRGREHSLGFALAFRHCLLNAFIKTQQLVLDFVFLLILQIRTGNQALMASTFSAGSNKATIYKLGCIVP